MDSRSDRPPKPVHVRAIEEDKWVVMGKRWLTAEQFFREFGKGLSLQPGSWRLADPLEAVKQAREIIKKMIEQREPYEKILRVLDRLHSFSDMVFKAYRSKDKYR